MLAECLPAGHLRKVWERRKAPVRGVGRMMGLLDSYRQEKGIATEPEKRKVPKRVVICFGLREAHCHSWERPGATNGPDSWISLQRHPRSVDDKPEDEMLCTPDCVKQVFTGEHISRYGSCSTVKCLLQYYQIRELLYLQTPTLLESCLCG